MGGDRSGCRQREGKRERYDMSSLWDATAFCEGVSETLKGLEKEVRGERKDPLRVILKEDIKDEAKEIREN